MLIALFVLFTGLATAEALIMLLLQLLSIQAQYFWIETFFDASIAAFFAMFLLRYLLQIKLIKPQYPLNAETVPIQSAIIVFGMQALLMLILPLIEHTLTVHQAIILDSVLFALLSTLTIYLFLLSPSGLNPQQSEEKPRNPLHSFAIRHLCAYLFGITLFALFLSNIYIQQQTNHIQKLILQESQQLQLAKSTLNNQLSHAILDIQSWAKRYDLTHQLELRSHAFAELAQDYKQAARIKKNYEQIRVINLQGQEEIRINNSPRGPLITAQPQLQDKSFRYYFNDTIQLNPDEVYISPMDLNVEHERIEIPFKPIVRASTIIYNPQGEKQGILVINVNAQNLLRQLDQAEVTMNGDVMLLNRAGYWLHGGEEEYNWAFMFPNKSDYTIHKRYPGVWEEINALDSGSIKTPYGYFIFQTIEAGPHHRSQHETAINNDHHWPRWKLISHVSTERFEAELSETSRLLLLFFILAAFVIAIGTMMYTRAQVNHLRAKIKIHHLAHHDALTGLCNRRLFMEMIDHELLHAKRSHSPLVLVYFDLDGFKPINDLYGHEAGDQILIRVAQRLKALLRESDTLCRMGGDEFAAILPNPGSREQIENIAQRMLDAFDEPFIVRGNSIAVGISIGLAEYHAPMQNRNALLHEADQAMYLSKKAGRNCFTFSRREASE